MGRAVRAAESHTPGGHGVSLTVHKAFLPSSKKKKKINPFETAKARFVQNSIESDIGTLCRIES